MDIKLTPYQKDLISGKTCPYCKSETKVVSEETDEQFVIYSVVSSFLCKGCGSNNIKERSGYKV